jgi:hypothetical protein
MVSTVDIVVARRLVHKAAYEHEGYSQFFDRLAASLKEG